MKISINSRRMDVSDDLKARVNKKLGKLSKYFGVETDANVMLCMEKSRHIAEVTVHFGGMIYRAEVSSHDMYESVDKATDIIERQIRKNKTRLEKRLHKTAFTNDIESVPGNFEEEGEFKIVKNKKFPIKPMCVEEAILQMNLIGHEFFVFTNDQTEDMNIVYKRKDGNYGLIEAM